MDPEFAKGVVEVPGAINVVSRIDSFKGKWMPALAALKEINETHEARKELDRS